MIRIVPNGTCRFSIRNPSSLVCDEITRPTWSLAAITLYPEIWAAAVDTVGISNWESFLKNTSSYRRRQREVEYGRLDKDIDFLRAISPIAKIDRVPQDYGLHRPVPDKLLHVVRRR